MTHGHHVNLSKLGPLPQASTKVVLAGALIVRLLCPQMDHFDIDAIEEVKSCPPTGSGAVPIF